MGRSTMITCHLRGSLYEIQEVIEKIEGCGAVPVVKKFKIAFSHTDEETNEEVYEQEIQIDLYAGLR